MIRVFYFARLREAFGLAEETIDPTPGDIAALLELLERRGEVWRETLAGRVLCAVNQEMAHPGTPLADGDEVGLFPPVTGG